MIANRFDALRAGSYTYTSAQIMNHSMATLPGVATIEPAITRNFSAVWTRVTTDTAINADGSTGAQVTAAAYRDVGDAYLVDSFIAIKFILPLTSGNDFTIRTVMNVEYLPYYTFRDILPVKMYRGTTDEAQRAQQAVESKRSPEERVGGLVRRTTHTVGNIGRKAISKAENAINGAYSELSSVLRSKQMSKEVATTIEKVGVMLGIAKDLLPTFHRVCQGFIGTTLNLEPKPPANYVDFLTGKAVSAANCYAAARDISKLLEELRPRRNPIEDYVECGSTLSGANYMQSKRR
jgi:hypothetical protein